MKFLCASCQRMLGHEATDGPHRGALSVTFRCASCGWEVALLTNPAETQLLSSLGIRIGGRTVPAEPLETVRQSLPEGASASEGWRDSADGEPSWTPEAEARLRAAPPFVQGMVRRSYNQYARYEGIAVVTPEVMDRARLALGMEGL